MAIKDAMRYIEEYQYTFTQSSIVSENKSEFMALTTMERSTELVREVWYLIKRMKLEIELKFHWVKSHCGVKRSERADCMAKDQIRQQESVRYENVLRNYTKKKSKRAGKSKGRRR